MQLTVEKNAVTSIWKISLKSVLKGTSAEIDSCTRSCIVHKLIKILIKKSKIQQVIPKKRNIRISYICSFNLILSYINTLQCGKKIKLSLPIGFFLYSGHQMNNKLFNILPVLAMHYCSTIIVLFEHMSKNKIFHFLGSLVSECIINAKWFISQRLAPKVNGLLHWSRNPHWFHVYDYKKVFQTLGSWWAEKYTPFKGQMRHL